jgi:MFS family permease
VDAATARRRLALFGLFLIPGLALSSWVTRTPDIRDLLGASTAEMGLVLFGLSAGSMIGILFSGRLVTRYGTRPIIAVASLTIVSCTPVVGLGAALSRSVLSRPGCSCSGWGSGAARSR